MSHTLFISDLHLCPSRPRVTKLFFNFLAQPAREAEALYILGDLFEYWIGDDDLQTGLNREVATALRALQNSGTQIRLMHGNRDFLIGEQFAEAAGLELIADPTLVNLNGTRILLMHGDTLCTDDVEYQRFREMVRARSWQDAFLSRPLGDRRREVESMRRRSEDSKRSKSMAIMDVADSAVEQALRIFACPPLLIHGHTHRPARHEHIIDGQYCVRQVLSDWHDDHAAYLKYDGNLLSQIELGS